MDKIYLSPSRLTAWYDMGCPAQWDYNNKWSTLETPRPLELGSKVHKALEDPEKYGDLQDDRQAELIYNKLRSIRDTIIQEIIPINGKYSEHFQRFEIAFDRFIVVWTRKIDVIVRLFDGTSAILDYKIAMGRGWKSIQSGGGIVYPQSLGFQSIGYLITDPVVVPAEWAGWPDTMLYLVGSMSASPQVIRYDYDKKDYHNFMDLLYLAAASIQESNKESGFPKRYGKNCLECPFSAMCYEAPGYKDLYKKRKYE